MKIKSTFLLILIFILNASFIEQFLVLIYPSYFPKTKYDFTNNPLNISKIALGKAIFYDPILSADNTISCASCHSPYNAFAHTDHTLSHGINNQIGNRNAPALFNLAWQKSFMWDGAIHHLDFQALAPINSVTEMGETTTSVVQKLNTSHFYKKLFYNAFSDSAATGERMLQSLAQFQLTIISNKSKYDLVRSKQTTFTQQEKNGYALFLKNCNSCHTEPLFSTYEFANNGLKLDSTLHDFGKGVLTKRSEDSMLFKIPSLRNLSYTYPYMHDGRFKKLGEVIHHYTHEIQPTKTLSAQLKKRIILTANERVDLLAFILTLNDKDFALKHTP
jgi:cytochrome c peroxidase